MLARPDLFASADPPRPGGLFDVLAARAAGDGRIAAATILEVLLEGLGRSGRTARPWTACRWGTAGCIPLCAAITRRIVSCRCINSRNGWPIR